MKKLLIAAAVVFAASPLAIANLAGAKPANPQGGSLSTNCGGSGEVLAWSPTNLWPPNHKPRTINITYRDSSPDSDTISIDIGQIAEFPANTDAVGAGHTSPDFTGANTTGTAVDDHQTAVPSVPVTLLSERSGQDMAGRTYLIPVTCHDGDGQDGHVNICITTPHDQHHAVVQDPNANCVTDATPA